MRTQVIQNKSRAIEKLKKIGQEHLLEFWDTLVFDEKEDLLGQISELDEEFFWTQKRLLFEKKKKEIAPLLYEPSFFSGNEEDQERGKELASKGKTACLILAGGQGSRLSFNGPKGCFPLTRIKKKSLFQLLAEKIRAASQYVGRDQPAAIMTSPLNHEQTTLYFQKNNYFGNSPSAFSFFSQRLWPLLDFEGNLFLESPGKIAFGPNGNGEVFLRLVETGIYEEWQERGIEIVNIISVDNPLALPFDFELFGFHHRLQNSVTFKTSFRKNREEKVGLLVKRGPIPTVLEYSEMEKPPLGLALANLGLYCVSLSFIREVHDKPMELHLAKKSSKKMGMAGVPREPNAWKFEKFIFDAFLWSKKSEALVYPREECFAPLKNLTGPDSIIPVQDALLALDRRRFAEISERPVEEKAVFELAPEFYYPDEAFRQKWKGKPVIDQTYIEA